MAIKCRWYKRVGPGFCTTDAAPRHGSRGHGRDEGVPRCHRLPSGRATGACRGPVSSRRWRATGGVHWTKPSRSNWLLMHALRRGSASPTSVEATVGMSARRATLGH